MVSPRFHGVSELVIANHALWQTSRKRYTIFMFCVIMMCCAKFAVSSITLYHKKDFRKIRF